MDCRTPVAIGGVGGSGTRVVATMLQLLGYDLGSDLNASKDNLWWALFFSRPDLLQRSDGAAEITRCAAMLARAMRRGSVITAAERTWIRTLTSPRAHHPGPWLEERARSLVQAFESERGAEGPWGWKAPGTHVFVDRLLVELTGLSYIHVQRNGLDMAFSENQNQLRIWGSFFLGHSEFELSPFWALKYWCAAHRRVAEIAARSGGRVLILDFDRLCTNSTDAVTELLRFLGVPITDTVVDLLARTIVPPSSIGRFRQRDMNLLDPRDVAYVHEHASLPP